MSNVLLHEKLKRVEIRDVMPLTMIENEIRGAISENNYEFLGQINLSRKEYNIITSKIKECLENGMRLKRVAMRWGVTLSVHLISFLQLDYKNDNVWDDWLQLLNSYESLNEVKQILLYNLSELGFSTDADSGLTYVTPFLRQAGIPNVCLNKIFNILKVDVNSRYFTSYDFVNDIIGYKSSYVDKPVYRHFRDNPEKAEDLIDNLSEIIVENIESNDIDDIISKYKIEKRIIEQYLEWKVIAKSNNKRDKSIVNFYKPKVIFDVAQGLNIFLPEQIITDEELTQAIWKIEVFDEANKIDEKKISLDIYDENDVSKVCETTIPVPLGKKYNVSICDIYDEPLTGAWEFNVFDEYGLAVFRNGKQIQEGTISESETVILYRSYTKILEINEVEYSEISLPFNYKNVTAISLYASNENSYVLFDCFDKKRKLFYKNDLFVKLNNESTLFNEKYLEREIAVFTDLPNFTVKGSLTKNMQLIIRSSKEKISKNISELYTENVGNQTKVFLDEDTKEKLENVYGKIEYKIYDGKNTKVLIFYKSPILEFNSNHTQFASNPHRCGFYIETKDWIDITWNEKEVKVINSNLKTYKEVYTEARVGVIHGVMNIDSDGRRIKIPFKKVIRPYEFRVWNEKSTTLETYGSKIIDYDEFIENDWTIIFQCFDKPNIPIKVSLIGENDRCLQEVETNLDSEGKKAIRVGNFIDTIKNNNLPLKICIESCDASIGSICAIKIVEKQEFPGIGYSTNYKGIYWNYDDKKQYENLQLSRYASYDSKTIQFTRDAVKKAKKAENRIFILRLDAQLETGVYVLKNVQDNQDIFFDDEKIDRTLDINSAFLANWNSEWWDLKEETLEEVLDKIIVGMLKNKYLESAYEKLRNGIHFRTKNSDIIKLIDIATNISSKSKLKFEARSVLREICQFLNDNYVKPKDRFYILKYILEKDFTEQEINLLIDIFQLYLFDNEGQPKISQGDFQKMWAINSNLAVLMCLKNCVENFSIHRVLSYIGVDALENIIYFNSKLSVDSMNWYEVIEDLIKQRKFYDVMVISDERVWGQYEEYTKLFVKKYKSVEFDVREIEEGDTDGFSLLRFNYLELFKKIIIGRKQKEEYKEKYAKLEKEYNLKKFKLNEITTKYSTYINEITNVMDRRNGGIPIGEICTNIGNLSILQVLSQSHKEINQDLEEVLNFIRKSVDIYPELFYRDLIVAQLIHLVKE